MKQDKEVIQMSRPLINKGRRGGALVALLAAISLLFVGCSNDDEPQRTTYLADEAGRLYASDHVIVKAGTGEAFDTMVARIEARGWDLMEVEDDQRLQNALGYFRVKLPVGTLPEDALDYLATNGLIESGTLNYQLEVLREPDDTFWDDINADLCGHRFVGVSDAWETTTGSPTTIVAVIDTGVDLTHVDLQENLVRSSNNPETIVGWDLVDGDLVPQDENGHGTHVAGVIGAVGNNSLGTVGLNWDVGLLPIRVFDAEGQGSLWNAAAGILLAAEAGAKVINASWGIAIDQPGPLLEAAQHGTGDHPSVLFLHAAHHRTHMRGFNDSCNAIGVQDLVDVHFVRHDEAHYANSHIAPGDRIISVDGKHAEDVSVDVLHSMLAGPLHSAVNITLARPHTGQKYSVVVLRHSYGAFDRHGGKKSEHVMEHGGYDSVTMSPAKAALVPRTPSVAPGELVTRFTRPSPFREATEAEQKEIFVAADITPGVGMSRPRALLVPTQSIARHQTGPHHLNH